MSVANPQSEADMLRIKGVGEVKFRKYGKLFLDFFQNQGNAGGTVSEDEIYADDVYEDFE